jgi:hypothetical protein
MKDFKLEKKIICDWDQNILNLFKSPIIHYEKELNTQSDIDKYCDLLNREREDDFLGKI